MSREMLEGYASLGRRMSLLLLLCSGNLPVASMQADRFHPIPIPFPIGKKCRGTNRPGKIAQKKTR